MSSPSIYRPDWSLPVAVLIGRSFLAAGIVYLLTISADNLTGSHQARLAGSQSQGHARSAAPATRSARAEWSLTPDEVSGPTLWWRARLGRVGGARGTAPVTDG